MNWLPCVHTKILRKIKYKEIMYTGEDIHKAQEERKEALIKKHRIMKYNTEI